MIQIREFKSRRVVATMNEGASERGAETACIQLYLQSDRRVSYFWMPA